MTFKKILCWQRNLFLAFYNCQKLQGISYCFPLWNSLCQLLQFKPTSFLCWIFFQKPDKSQTVLDFSPLWFLTHGLDSLDVFRLRRRTALEGGSRKRFWTRETGFDISIDEEYQVNIFNSWCISSYDLMIEKEILWISSRVSLFFFNSDF